MSSCTTSAVGRDRAARLRLRSGGGPTAPSSIAPTGFGQNGPYATSRPSTTSSRLPAVSPTWLRPGATHPDYVPYARGRQDHGPRRRQPILVALLQRERTGSRPVCRSADARDLVAFTLSEHWAASPSPGWAAKRATRACCKAGASPARTQDGWDRGAAVHRTPLEVRSSPRWACVRHRRFAVCISNRTRTQREHSSAVRPSARDPVWQRDDGGMDGAVRGAGPAGHAESTHSTTCRRHPHLAAVGLFQDTEAPDRRPAAPAAAGGAFQPHSAVAAAACAGAGSTRRKCCGSGVEAREAACGDPSSTGRPPAVGWASGACPPATPRTWLAATRADVPGWWASAACPPYEAAACKHA